MLRPSPKYRTLRLPNDADVYLLLLDCLVCDVAALYIYTSKEPVCPRVELIFKIIIILLIIFLGFIKSKPC